MDHDEELELLNRLHDRMQGQERPPGSDGIQFDEDLRCLRLMLARRAADDVIDAARGFLADEEPLGVTEVDCTVLQFRPRAKSTLNTHFVDGVVIISGVDDYEQPNTFVLLTDDEVSAYFEAVQVLRDAVNAL